MNKFFPLLLLPAAAAAACDSARQDISIRGLARPTEACEVNSDALLEEVILDTAEGTALNVPIFADNTGEEPLLPLELEVRWLCATTPALVLPDLGATSSFCLDGVDPNFIGFDAYPVITSAIPAGERALVSIPLVPAQIGSAFDRMLTVARAADGCCRDASCTRNDTTNIDCEKFTAMTGGPGGTLEPAQFRDFAIYDGTYADNSATLGERYKMTAGFVLRGRTDTQVEVYSAPFQQNVSFCRSCGEREESGARRPMPGMSCFHSATR